MMHAVDWFPTILHLAGAEARKLYFVYETHHTMTQGDTLHWKTKHLIQNKDGYTGHILALKQV